MSIGANTLLYAYDENVLNILFLNVREKSNILVLYNT